MYSKLCKIEEKWCRGYFPLHLLILTKLTFNEIREYIKILSLKNFYDCKVTKKILKTICKMQKKS